MREYFKFGIACAVLILAISASVSLADAQMPRAKDCRKGMTFQQCHDQCRQVGGTSGSAVQRQCANRCYRMGCKWHRERQWRLVRFQPL